MRKEKLYTATGEYVATVEVPPFPDEKMPDVIMWGSRIFIKKSTPDGPEYYEGFAVAAINTVD